jgi:soluble lytic murein transglycosylase-like protein
MLDVANHGGSVERSGRGFPLHTILCRVALACALLFSGLCWLPSARAGALYHCTGSQGEAVYSSTAAGYHGCRKISTFGRAATHRKTMPMPTSLTAVSGSVTTTAHALATFGTAVTSLAEVQGTVETSARALGAPQLRQVSLAAVRGSVETSARLPLASAVAGTPGQWSYHESRGVAGVATAAEDPASRILRGAVYRIVRADGSVEYTNLQPVNQKGRSVTMLFSYIATCIACNLHSPIRWGSVSLNLNAYADTIRAASIEYGVDEAFLRAIIHAESAFNPRAMSLKGAQGLMQLMPATASDMGVLDAFNTDQNIRGGARYLSLLLHDFNGNEQLAAAAYNAGPGAVQRYSGVPPYAETQVYVVRVATLRKRYDAAIHPPLASRNAG